MTYATCKFKVPVFAELDDTTRQRKGINQDGSVNMIQLNGVGANEENVKVKTKPRISNRLWLLLLAITVHNIPEGLAVGVAFGAEDGSLDSFNRAR